MPEGPEVFRKAEQIRSNVVGKHLLTLLLHGETDEEITVSSTVTCVGTKGKKLWLELDNHMFILFSFALEGELSPKEGEQTGIIAELKFEDGLTYSHTDHMRIAKCYYTNNIEELLPDGVDPLHDLYGMREWLKLCRTHSGRQIARFLVDQDMICGIGNIYRSEVLHLSQIYPTLRLGDVEEKKLENLLVNIYRVSGEAAKGHYTLQVHGNSFDLDNKPVVKVRVAKSLYVWSSMTAPLQKTVIGGPRKKNIYQDPS